MALVPGTFRKMKHYSDNLPKNSLIFHVELMIFSLYNYYEELLKIMPALNSKVFQKIKPLE